MPLFDLEAFKEDGIFREQQVREAFASLDWERYRGKTVHIRGCGSTPIPTWIYLMAAARLAQVARRITFGEEKNPLPVFVRDQPEPSQSTGRQNHLQPTPGAGSGGVTGAADPGNSDFD